MSDYVPVQVTDLTQVLSFDRIRLRSWKGDYLHRPDTPQGVTTWNTGIGNEWQARPGPDGSVMLRSWKGDYLHRPNTPQDVTTWNTGIGNEWRIEPNGATFRLRSWKGDYLHRPDTPQGVTTWSTGIGNEWILEGLRLDRVAGDLFNTTPWGTGSTIIFRAGATFTQRFQAAISSLPVELAVRMGSNQNRYGARVEIRVNDQLHYSRDYIDLTQRTSDWATVFPILDFPATVRAGDWVSVSITPDRDTGIAMLNVDNPQCPRGTLASGASFVACFSLRGDVVARSGTLPAPDPSVIGSTMDEGGSTWLFAGGSSFTQRFKAIGHGVPHQLGVVMDSDPSGYSCRVTVSVRGAQVFDRRFDGVSQRAADWASVFDLDGIPAIAAGDDVAFTLTPDRSVRFHALQYDRVGYEKGSIVNYGACRAKFFMKV